jgi:Ran GTPase-activating protein (RanGAP) involved in mRNA processing and transport
MTDVRSYFLDTCPLWILPDVHSKCGYVVSCKDCFEEWFLRVSTKSRSLASLFEKQNSCGSPGLSIPTIVSCIMPRRSRRNKKAVQWCFAPPLAPPVETFAARYFPDDVTGSDLRWNTFDANKGKQIAMELATNTRLKGLGLTFNDICDDAAMALAGALATNKSLISLSLSLKGNEALSLHDAGIEALGGTLKRNNSLRELCFRGIKLTIPAMTSLANALKINKRLTELRLHSDIDDEGAIVLADALRSNTSLTEVDLYNNRIGDRGVAAIGEALMVNASLIRLYLHKNNIGDEGVKSLAMALYVNTSLTDLYLSYNGIRDTGVVAVGEALKANTSLSCLDLSCNIIGDAGTTALGEALKTNTTLSRLDLDSTRIGHGGAASLGEALKVNTSLTRLFLGNNTIGDVGAASILNGLAGWNTTLKDLAVWGNNILGTLESAINAFSDANRAGIRLLHAEAKLDLSSKWIGEAQAKQVGEELAVNTTVTTLILNQNEIGYPGCMDVADALIKNRVLTSVELDDNSIGDAGCSAMAMMLLQNAVLTRISLNGNRIGLAGVTALAKAVTSNSHLRRIGLGRNKVGDEGAMAMARALKSNETLQRLDLHGNSISDEGALSLRTALEHYNHVLTSLNLDYNAEISPVVLSAIGFVLTSRHALISFSECLHKPLEKRLMSLVIQGVQLNSIHHENVELAHGQETGGGTIFLLVRAAALNDSKVINETAPSRTGPVTRNVPVSVS